MQILSISGENIASLAERFDIRLDQAPLASAGLFAITGETGAGKSSLLDAMCLALYGNCPRLSGDGTRETIDDIDGQALRSNDPRMALRRGAAMGFAEVSFQANDGAIYTAGWQARRARDKIDGRLQSIERSLVRASDGQVLETQLSRVNDAVTDLTGLTYDEFRRTVLLAQGDFDAFLGAKTDQRAAILEKVTGTGIYRDISRKVYERHKDAQTSLATLETRRGEHRPLTEDEREALTQAITLLRQQQNAGTTALAAVQTDLDTYKAIEAAQAHLTAATQRLTQSKAALAALTDDRTWLASWDAAQGLRAEVREVRDATTALAEATHQQAKLAEDHATKQTQLANADGLFQTASIERERSETAFKSFNKDWDKAADLDSRIATATQEHADALTSLTERRKAERDCQSIHDGLLAQHRAQNAAITALQNELEATPGHAALLAEWGVIQERLEARIEQSEAALGATTEGTKLTESIAEDQANRAQLEAGIQSQRAQISAAQQAQDQIKHDRAGLQSIDPAARLDRLGQAQINLTALRHASEALRRADDDLAASQARRTAAQAAHRQHQDTAKSATATAQEAGRLIDVLRQPAEAADAAASQEAEHLRQHLLDGAPCPVCQSTDHPVMQNDQIARLATDLRSRLAAAQSTRDTGLAEATTAQANMASAEAILASETSREPALTAQIAQRQSQFDRATGPLKDGPLSDDLPDDPRAPDARFEALLDQLSDQRDAVEKDRDRLETLNRVFQNAATAQEAGTAEITKAEAAKRDIDSRISNAEARITSLTQTAKTAQTTIAAIDKRLLPLMAPTTLSVQDFGANTDAPARLQSLRQHVAALTKTQSQITETTANLATLTTKIAAAQSALTGATANRTHADQIADTRRLSTDGLRRDRTALLGGEATGAHRSRHNAWRTSAQQASEHAQADLGKQTSEFAALTSAINVGQGVIAKAATRRKQAQSALATACAATGLDHDTVITLHGADTAAVQACRDRLRAADVEVTSAEGARQEREVEHSALHAKGMPKTAKTDLEASKLSLEADTQARSEVLGQHTQTLTADADAAKAISGLEAQITAARQTSDTWTAVNDAVGSARGDRFAQIAQAVTLALLVERANLHLDDLKPRFQLRVATSDLALHVIDRDMAGDVRPTRLLSGGERFLVSLALALALSGMGTKGALAGTLFIDEGFGSLDADSLDLAIDALEQLQAQGRTVGVISHVQAMKDRIPVQIQVVKTGGGASKVSLVVR